MSLFDLAREQLEKKHVKFTALDVFDRAVAIRRALDEQDAERERKALRRYRARKKSKWYDF